MDHLGGRQSNNTTERTWWEKQPTIPPGRRRRTERGGPDIKQRGVITLSRAAAVICILRTNQWLIL